MPHGPTLPLEILELFIDEVGSSTSDSRQALGACLSVSRSFRRRARHHLFRFIDPVSTYENQKFEVTRRISFLRQLTVDAPNDAESIAPLVRHLTVSFTCQALDCWDFVQILERLMMDDCCVECMILRGPNLNYPSWKAYSNKFQETICRLSRWPSLKILIVTNILEIPTSFFRGIRMQKLNTRQLFGSNHLFTRGQPSEESETGDEHDDCEMAIQSLFTDHSCKVYLFDEHHQFFGAPSLRQASFRINRQDGMDGSISKILPCIRKSLEDLTLQILPNHNLPSDSDVATFDLGLFPRLRTVQCLFSLLNQPEGCALVAGGTLENVLATFARLLRTSTSPPSLSTIHLSLHFLPGVSILDETQDSEQWKRLNETLSQQHLIDAKFTFKILLSLPPESFLHSGSRDIEMAIERIKLAIRVSSKYQEQFSIRVVWIPNR